MTTSEIKTTYGRMIPSLLHLFDICYECFLYQHSLDLDKHIVPLKCTVNSGRINVSVSAVERYCINIL